MSAPRTISLYSPQTARRRWVFALALVGTALFGASWFFPYWNFALFAPQYPQGLDLIIHLNGVKGDVQEINIINHYIGMGHLDQAAQLERQYGGWLVGLLGIAIVLTTMYAGRNLGWVTLLVGLGLPVGFVADTFYWMYRFGHDLDPKAPIDMKPFTPTLFGEGKVGQFRTVATPDLGYWLAILGLVLLAVAVWQRRKVCQGCGAPGGCGAVCKHGFAFGPRDTLAA